MIKILAIGNSFSRDATTYLHQIAACGGTETKVVNLYVPNCSLQMHWENAVNNEKSYEYDLNGTVTGEMASIRETLLADEWDFVTLQQSSRLSGMPKTYFPYITSLLAYVREFSPGSKQLFHQTWAYETDSTHAAFVSYHNSQSEMHTALKEATEKVAQHTQLAIIPCGDVIQALRQTPAFDYANGGRSLCRDGFHMDLTYGRYALAAAWYKALLGGDIRGNSFAAPEAEAELVRLIQQTVHETLHTYQATDNYSRSGRDATIRGLS